MDNTTIDIDALILASDSTAAWLSNPNTRANAQDVPAALQAIFAEVSSLSSSSSPQEAAPAEVQKYTGAVTVRKSLASDDHIISMIDGKPYRSLRRHLSTNGLTPEEYRERYKLKPDYPMVAPSYSDARRQMAHKIGLGSKGRAARAATNNQPEKEPRKPRAAKAETE